MKLLLNTKKDKRLGSDRIWIYDLFDNLNEADYPVSINDWTDYSKYDAVIFGKSTQSNEIKKAKISNEKILTGIVNPSDSNTNNKKKLSLCDFFIVGSAEEQAYYLQYNNNVFVYPLVEKIYTKKKQHVEKDTIVIGYHGNLQHIKQMGSEVIQALNNISLEYRIKFKLIYNLKELGKWKDNLISNEITVEHIQWDLDTIESELLECDIGIVPSVIDCKRNPIEWLKSYYDKYLNSNDYVIRFKNTTNSGRAIVFMQLGIPVVAGFAPSNFELIGNNARGLIAHSSASWEYYLKNLISSSELRNKISLEAKSYIEAEYDMKRWSKDIYYKLKHLKNESQRTNK